jgi:hypothetical protein
MHTWPTLSLSVVATRAHRNFGGSSSAAAAAADDDDEGGGGMVPTVTAAAAVCWRNFMSCAVGGALSSSSFDAAVGA